MALTVTPLRAQSAATALVNMASAALVVSYVRPRICLPATRAEIEATLITRPWRRGNIAPADQLGAQKGLRQIQVDDLSANPPVANPRSAG